MGRPTRYNIECDAMESEDVEALAPGGTRGRVLVVEDEDSLRRAYARILENAGFDVREAGNGVEAVRALTQERFQVVLADIALPCMDGVEVLRCMREWDLDVPVILVTGNPSIETAVEALELRALHYLIKPVDPEELVRVVVRASKLERIARVKREAVLHFGPSDRRFENLTALEANLVRCLSRLWIAYQPIVDYRRRTIVAYEALVRSNEPMLPDPGALFSTAERLARLHDVGRAIRAKVAHDLAGLPRGCDLFINIHPTDFFDDALAAPDSPLSAFAERVVLEVTERARLEGGTDIYARVRRLREMGFRVAIDDLGAGYAGLNYFAQLVPDVVKIDVALVRGIDHSEVKQKLVGSLATVCRDLGMVVVAEGVETPNERDIVSDLGCDLLQGYLFARPGPPFPAVVWT